MKKKSIDGVAKRGKTRAVKSYNMGGRVGRVDLADGREPAGRPPVAPPVMTPRPPAIDSDEAQMRRIPIDSDRQALIDTARARREAGLSRARQAALRNVGRAPDVARRPIRGGDTDGAAGRGMKHGGRVKKK